MSDRIGFYCWAGPGTIRMINLKFFSPPIDTKSIMTSYDYDYLSSVKEKFGITDFWATYSWGFSESVEKEDHEFLLSRIGNFKKLGLKLHAYVQGTNLVYKDFKDKDWFCKDHKGRPITYYRGRRVTCLNNPGFREFMFKKVNSMTKHNFDGIYMDNIQMGQFGWPTFEGLPPFVFAGCTCKYCRDLFQAKVGEKIPLDFEKDPELTQKYLDFRTNCTTDFLRETADIVHKAKMEFGTNSFDPRFNTEVVYGTRLPEIDKIQDYVLFENHSLPNPEGTRSNSYVANYAKKLSKPVFVVSYKEGIGREDDFSQEDFDDIYSEDKQMPFFACIKGSEYTTHGIWHNLYLDKYSKPKRDIRLMHRQNAHLSKKFASKLHFSPVKAVIKYFYNPFLSQYMENKLFRRVFEKLYYAALH